MVGDVTPRKELNNVTKKIGEYNGKHKIRKVATALAFANKMAALKKN